MNVLLRARIVPRKEANGRYPLGVIWDENFVFFSVITPEFEEKIYLCTPKYFSAPTPVTLLLNNLSSLCITWLDLLVQFSEHDKFNL